MSAHGCFLRFLRRRFQEKLKKRKILGTEFSGTVEAVGTQVTRFKSGDAVFGSSGAAFGAYAEYLCLPEDGVLAVKPDHISFEAAAAVPFGSLAALFFLRDRGHIRSGQKVLVNGAAGGVGTAAVQIAKYFDTQVIGVCSTANAALVSSLGADKVVDYTRADFTKGDDTYDIIFDTVGNLSVARSKKVLNSRGVFLTAVIELRHLVQMARTAMAGSKKVIGAIASEKAEDLNFLKGLLENERIKPFIDRVYPLDRIVEAHRYAEKGHKRGNVVVTVRG